MTKSKLGPRAGIYGNRQIVMKAQDKVPIELQTQEELSRLVALAQGGDEKAKEALQYRMRPLVVNVARRYQKAEGIGGRYYNRHDEDDIEMAAWVGLWEAVQRYDPDHEAGKKFWTVANYRITHHVKEWVARNSGSISMPRKAWRQAYDIDHELEAAGMVDWENYTAAELKEVTGVNSAEAILHARRHAWEIDPDQDGKKTTNSAEQEYLEMSYETDLSAAIEQMSGAIQQDDPDVAEGLAWDYVDAHGPFEFPVQVVDAMVAEAERTQA